jgi:Flp pilus assembly pilin Flp
VTLHRRRQNQLKHFVGIADNPAQARRADVPCPERGDMTKLQISIANMALRLRRGFVLAGPEDGQTLAEYALILTLIAVVAVAALVFLGGTLTKLFSTTGNKI